MIDSPCNDICTIDSESGLCVGCGRTPSEITNWIHYSDNEKKIILNTLKKGRNNIDNIHDNMLDNRIMNNLFNVVKKQIFPIGLILILALARLIPHPPNFTSLLALSFYIPALIGIRYLPALIMSFVITDFVIGFHGTTLFTWGSVIVIGLGSKFFISSIFTSVLLGKNDCGAITTNLPLIIG